MTKLLPERDVAQAFLEACRLELAALKPGNVHVHAGGHGMLTEHFELAAAAAAPHIAAAGLPVGARIRRAVEASFAAVGCNTNLGIILLCTPLAFAAQALVSPQVDLRDRLAQTLRRLNRDDAAEAFRAIAHANPGGLGRSAEADVSAPAEVTLLEAMKVAAGRDRIARAYTDAFADIFGYGLPFYREALNAAETKELAVTTLHMHFLAGIPDTHILRKYGEAAAREVQSAASALAAHWQPVVLPSSLPALADFDRQLKADGINPGTTADFVVTTIFTEKLLAKFASAIS